MEDIGFGKFEEVEKIGRCPGCHKIFKRGKCENLACSNAHGPLINLEPGEISKIQEEGIKPWTEEEMIKSGEEIFKVLVPAEEIKKADKQEPQPGPRPATTKKTELEDSKKGFQPVIDAINSRLDKWITAVSRGKEEIPTEFFVKRKAEEIIKTEMKDYVILKKGAISENGLETILKNIKVPEIKGASELLKEILKEIKEKIKKEGTQDKVL